MLDLVRGECYYHLLVHYLLFLGGVLLTSVRVYTDGSYNNQVGVGGWSVVNDDYCLSGVMFDGNPFILEAYAVYMAMFIFNGLDEIVICCDCKSLVRMLCVDDSESIDKYCRRHWIMGLIYDLMSVSESCFVFHKVKAHSGNRLNCLADKMAKKSYKGLL